MLELFKADSKVQKDRKIMRETDARMAKYSRRGLLFSFFVFILALVVGEFYVRFMELALFLAVGFLILTLIRGYLLFRFDSLYPRAPARWRNIYFIVSFAGAVWWSAILCSMTLGLGLNYEVPFMWFYTVVFFATITNVMAPYRRFMTIYLYIGVIPGALCALLLGTVDGYLYGFTFLILLMLLRNQIRLVCQTYWDRLEANFLLKQKASILEVEKRDSMAAVEFNNSFLSNLSNDFRNSLNDIMGALSLLDNSTLTAKQKEWVKFAEKAGEQQLNLVNNVQDFSQLNSDSLLLDVTVFNLRRHIESLLEDLTLEANRQGLELNYIFSHNLPLRVKGDAIRIGQVLVNLVQVMINRSEGGELLLTASQDMDENDHSIITFAIENIGGTVNLDETDLADNLYSQAHRNPGIGLGLTISNGLSKSMGGFIHFSQKDGASQFTFQLQLEEMGSFVRESLNLSSQRILMLGLPACIEADITEHCEFWGLLPEIVHTKDAFFERIDDAARDVRPYEMVLFYSGSNLNKTVNWLKELAALTTAKDIKCICAIGVMQEEDKIYRDNRALFDKVEIIYKPLIRHQLKEKIRHFTTIKDEEHSPAKAATQHVLIVDDQRVDQQVVDAMVRKMDFKTTVVSSGEEALAALEKQPFDLVLMDCNMPGLSGYETAEKIRSNEAGSDKHIPIIAITSDAGEGELGICLTAGMDDYISKPTRYNELQKRIHRWLDENGAPNYK